MVPPRVTTTTQIKARYDVFLRIMPWGGVGWGEGIMVARKDMVSCGLIEVMPIKR